MYSAADSTMVQCPYNRFHVLSKLKIQRHIIKCKQNYPEVKLATCFYNYTHRVKPEDMLEHYEMCPNKARVEGARYYETNDRFCNSSVKSNQENFRWMDSLRDCSPLHRGATQSGSFPSKDKAYTASNCSIQTLDDEYCHRLGKLNFDEEDDELEPLPLPKTISKAFTVSTNSKSDLSSASSVAFSQTKSFGRGKNILQESTPRSQRSTDHLLPDVSDIQTPKPKKGITSENLFRDLNVSCSEFSEMFDDQYTLISEEIVFDKDDGADDNFICKDLDKYKKI